MVYPSDDRHLRAHILAQRSREIRRLAAARQAAPAEVMRVIGELIREAEALLRDYPSPGGRGGADP